jgi:hypothetical protein
LALALQRFLETNANTLPLLHALALEGGRQPDVAQANIPNRSIAHYFRLSEFAGTVGKKVRERKPFPAIRRSKTSRSRHDGPRARPSWPSRRRIRTTSGGKRHAGPGLRAFPRDGVERVDTPLTSGTGATGAARRLSDATARPRLGSSHEGSDRGRKREDVTKSLAFFALGQNGLISAAAYGASQANALSSPASGGAKAVHQWPASEWA